MTCPRRFQSLPKRTNSWQGLELDCPLLRRNLRFLTNSDMAKESSKGPKTNRPSKPGKRTEPRATLKLVALLTRRSAPVRVAKRALRPAESDAAPGPAKITGATKIRDVVPTRQELAAFASTLQNTFGIKLPTGEIERAATFGELIRLIRSKLPSPLGPLG